VVVQGDWGGEGTVGGAGSEDVGVGAGDSDDDDDGVLGRGLAVASRRGACEVSLGDDALVATLDGGVEEREEEEEEDAEVTELESVVIVELRDSASEDMSDVETRVMGGGWTEG
jgi:hypothetical protein